MRIETPTDFLAQVNEGDVLYQMRSWLGKPTDVERITVTRIENVTQDGVYGGEPHLMCHYIDAHGSATRGFVSDMLNRWHGVWTDLEEALVYMAERKASYETDPELIEEHKETLKESKRWRAYMNNMLEP